MWWNDRGVKRNILLDRFFALNFYLIDHKRFPLAGRVLHVDVVRTSIQRKTMFGCRRTAGDREFRIRVAAVAERGAAAGGNQRNENQRGKAFTHVR